MWRSVRVLGVALASLACLWAQEKRPRIAIQHYTIDAEVNPRTQSVTATAKIRFTPLEDTSAAVFELNNAFTVSKATDSTGQPVTTTRTGQDFTVRFTFASSLPKDKATELTVTYDGHLTGTEDSPVYGIKFAALHPDYGYLMYPARWFPINDYTTNRYAADIRVTCPSEYKVLGSGNEKTEKLSGDRAVYAFQYAQAGFPGSIALVKGNAQRISSQGITTDIYFREHKDQAQAYGEEAGKIMTYFTSIFGLAPQANLTLVETEEGTPNGYAAPGLIFLSPNTIGSKVNIKILANNLARQWFGILTSPINRNHIWLANGPARYAELLYVEHLNGPGQMETELRSSYVEALTVSDPPVLQAARLEDYSPEYWALTAAKGAAVLHMLRGVVGDENFQKILRGYTDRFSYKSASSADFRKIAEEVSGQNLQYFFLQWLESSGAPEFKMEYTVFRTTKGFRIVGKIAQDLDTFRMPVNLRIETEGNPEDKQVEVTGTSSEFAVDTFGKPRNVIIDPNHRVLRFDKTTRVSVAIRRGEQFFEISDFSGALREYQNALEVNRNSSLAHYRIGELFFRQNNYQSAANEFREAINGDLEPKWTEVWSHLYLGKVFDVTGQRDRAMNEYKQAIRTRDNTAGAQEEAAKYSTKPYERKRSET